MLFLALLATAAWVGGAVSTGGGAVTVELRNGSSIRGALLSRSPERVVVDLGFTVVSVPGDQVSRIVEADTLAASDPAGPSGTSLYRAGSGAPPLSVRENVARVSSAVVQVRTPTGLGSGFFIHPDGYLVTNHHVVSGETALSVIRYEGEGPSMVRRQHDDVRLLAIDPRFDLALLQVMGAPSGGFPTVPLGESEELSSGLPVFAIGSPLGLERTVSEGIVSLRNRAIEGGLYVQTTTQINPGNSGGPLFNLRGEVVGVNNMKPMMVGVEGVNFAIPVSVLKLFLANRDAYAYDPRNPNAGFRYQKPVQTPGAAPQPAQPSGQP